MTCLQRAGALLYNIFVRKSLGVFFVLFLKRGAAFQERKKKSLSETLSNFVSWQRKGRGLISFLRGLLLIVLNSQRNSVHISDRNWKNIIVFEFVPPLPPQLSLTYKLINFASFRTKNLQSCSSASLTLASAQRERERKGGGGGDKRIERP